MAPLTGSACSGPRCMAHLMASTSQPAGLPGPWRCAGRRQGHARAPPPPRITNTQKEIWDANDENRDRLKGLYEDNAEYVRVNDMPIWEPEKGPLGDRIKRTLMQEQATDEISVLETAYWFHTPPGGWRTNMKMYVVPEVEGEFPQPEHTGEDKDGRFPLEFMEEGLVVEGVVTDIWLYHGAQVDFLGEFDGLIPIGEEEWKQEAVKEALLPGTLVKVRIHRLLQRDKYRWPVQLELLDETVAPLITPPDEYHSPADLGWAYDQGWDLDQVCQQLGRTYRKVNYQLEPDMALVADNINWQYGWDEPEINGNPDDWVTRMVDTATNIDITEMAGQALLGEI